MNGKHEQQVNGNISAEDNKEVERRNGKGEAEKPAKGMNGKKDTPAKKKDEDAEEKVGEAEGKASSKKKGAGVEPEKEIAVGKKRKISEVEEDNQEKQKVVEPTKKRK